MWNMNMMDDFSKQWETMMKSWFDNLMKNPEFMENLSKSMEGALNSKSVMNDVKNKIAKSLSVPTADMIGKIGQYIIRQEAKIADLEDLIYDQSQELSEIKSILLELNKKNKKTSTTASAKKTTKSKAVKSRTTKKTTKTEGK